MTLIQIHWNIDPEIFKVGGFSLRYYSLLFGIGVVAGYAVIKKIFQSEKISQEHLGSLLLYMVLGTAIGARLGHVLFYEFSYYKNHPLEIILPFRFSQNGLEWTGYEGLASHGGAIGILVALALYCRKYQYSMLWMLDRLVISIALAGCFIRLGNLFNSEIIGKPATVSWAFVFQRVDNIPRHPSQLYEAAAYLIIFGILLTAYKRSSLRMRKGFLLGLFLLLVFSSRFIVEFTKEDQESFESGWSLNLGQILSIPFIVAGIYFLFRNQTGKLNHGDDA